MLCVGGRPTALFRLTLRLFGFLCFDQSGRDLGCPRLFLIVAIVIEEIIKSKTHGLCPPGLLDQVHGRLLGLDLRVALATTAVGVGAGQVFTRCAKRAGMGRPNVGYLDIVDQIAISICRCRQVARDTPSIVYNKLKTMSAGWQMKHARVITLGFVQEDLGSPLIGKCAGDEDFAATGTPCQHDGHQRRLLLTCLSLSLSMMRTCTCTRLCTDWSGRLAGVTSRRRCTRRA